MVTAQEKSQDQQGPQGTSSGKLNVFCKFWGPKTLCTLSLHAKCVQPSPASSLYLLHFRQHVMCNDENWINRSALMHMLRHFCKFVENVISSFPVSCYMDIPVWTKVDVLPTKRLTLPYIEINRLDVSIFTSIIQDLSSKHRWAILFNVAGSWNLWLHKRSVTRGAADINDSWVQLPCLSVEVRSAALLTTAAFYVIRGDWSITALWCYMLRRKSCFSAMSEMRGR